MWLTVGNSFVRVSNETADEAAFLNEYLAFDDSKAAFRMNPGDGRKHMFKGGAFATGFLAMVRQAVLVENQARMKLGQPLLQIQLLDQRPGKAKQAPGCERPTRDEYAELNEAGRLEPLLEGHPFGWLRPYQADAVRACLRTERGVVKVPTAGGKTEVMAALVQALPGVRWLMVVHRASLMTQAAERYTLRTGKPAGIVGDGQWQPLAGPGLTCATFQTLVKAKGTPRGKALLESIGGLLVDEAHTLPSSTFWNLAMGCKSAFYRFGFSGTPLDRGDQRSVMTVAALGPIVYRIKAQVLQEAGVLAIPTIQMVPVKQPWGQGQTWAEVNESAIEQSPARNALVVEATRVAEKPCMLFVKGVEHGRLLEALLARAGMRAAFVFGGDSSEERRSALAELVAGKLEVLIASVVFNEGIDVPSLRSVVIASGGKSVIAALQRIGRGMRIERNASGAVIKGTFQVWDFLDQGCGCKTNGALDLRQHRACKWLEKHSKARQAAYLSQGYAVTEKVLVPSSGAKQQKFL